MLAYTHPLQSQEPEMKMSMEMMHLPAMDLIYETLCDKVHYVLQHYKKNSAQNTSRRVLVHFKKGEGGGNTQLQNKS